MVGALALRKCGSFWDHDKCGAKTWGVYEEQTLLATQYAQLTTRIRYWKSFSIANRYLRLSQLHQNTAQEFNVTFCKTEA